MKLSVKVKGAVITFDSPHSDKEAISRLESLVKSGKLSGEFATSLVKKALGKWGLSAAQIAWVHKLVADVENPPKGAEPVVLDDNGEIFELFKEGGKKYPKITFGEVRLSYVKSKGHINVTNGKSFYDADNKWYGRIVLKDGVATFDPSKKSFVASDLPDVTETVKGFAASPVAFAAAYGKACGSCCFCSKELTTAESLEAGYGPDCAKRYGLPWGKKKAKKKAVTVAVTEEKPEVMLPL